MKITGSRNSIIFDMENGYIVKAEGEMLVGKKFVVYKNTMKFEEPPHETEQLTPNQISEIIAKVQNKTHDNTMQLIFV